ncbi:hypothetical protein [Mycolicibacterium sp.]|uniref:hypothetical protein n=1 Tax=Mycolicibacterium sp. TaxID=2320850 RepID=UPI0037CC678A
MRTLNIEDGEAELHEYFGSAEYLPAEVKDRRTLMAQDLGNIIACLIAATWRHRQLVGRIIRTTHRLRAPACGLLPGDLHTADIQRGLRT